MDPNPRYTPGIPTPLIFRSALRNPMQPDPRHGGELWILIHGIPRHPHPSRLNSIVAS